MSTLDDAVVQLAAAQLAFDIANTNRYNTQVAADSAAAVLALAKVNYENILINQLAAINTPDAIIAAKAATSTVTDILLAERNAGIQGASIFIKANPTATKEEATAAWTTAAFAATNLNVLLQDPVVLFTLYATNLVNKGVIPDTTWESVIAWIINTPIEIILAG